MRRERDETFLAECFVEITEVRPEARAPFSCDRPRRTKWRSTSLSREFQMPSPLPYLGFARSQGQRMRRDKGASVNREIEPAKHFRQQMFVRFAKLIADVRRDARFDAACTQTNQKQSDREHRSLPNCNSPGSGHAREREVAQAVDDRQRENGPIFAQPAVGDDRAENRKKVYAENEVMRCTCTPRSNSSARAHQTDSKCNAP